MYGYNSVEYSGFLSLPYHDDFIEMIEYPEHEVFLKNGASFNPFVMPEAIYKEDGLLYLEVGQGADGDYYGEDGFCHGRYASADRGKTWEFVETFAVE